VVLDPLAGSRFGYIRIRDGKSKNARRILPLTDKAAQMLRNRQQTASGELAFANRDGRRYLVTSINHLHQKARALVGLGKDFVIHSLRHTMLTRLGESNVDAFTIMKIAGHSSITVSQRYVHPSPEAVERAFERLQLSGNQGQIEPKVLLPPTKFPTVGGAVLVSH
jgi:integrase